MSIKRESVGYSNLYRRGSSSASINFFPRSHFKVRMNYKVRYKTVHLLGSDGISGIKLNGEGNLKYLESPSRIPQLNQLLIVILYLPVVHIPLDNYNLHQPDTPKSQVNNNKQQQITQTQTCVEQPIPWAKLVLLTCSPSYFANHQTLRSSSITSRPIPSIRPTSIAGPSRCYATINPSSTTTTTTRDGDVSAPIEGELLESPIIPTPTRSSSSSITRNQLPPNVVFEGFEEGEGIAPPKDQGGRKSPQSGYGPCWSSSCDSSSRGSIGTYRNAIVVACVGSADPGSTICMSASFSREHQLIPRDKLSSSQQRSLLNQWGRMSFIDVLFGT
jgi:hypothetical protein